MKPRDDDAFGRKLHEAGVSVTPATSEDLHARVMADVRREQAMASSSAAASAGRARWWWLIGTAAAAAAVAVWVTTSREPTVAPPPYAPVAQLPPLPSIEAAVVEKMQPVREKLHEARFAYLDRDTKRLARFLLRSVPGMPADARPVATEGATPSSASGT